MASFIDLTCPKCKKRFGFAGKSMMDCPPCPKCNHQIDKEKLKKDEEEMEKFRQFLKGRKTTLNKTTLNKD